MKIGTTSDFFDIDNLKRIKGAGFDCIDAQGLVNPESELYKLSDEAFDQVTKNAKEMVDALGLSVSQLHGPWRYPPKDGTESDREKIFPLCERALRACVALGCHYMVLHPLMPFGAGEEVDSAFAREVNAAFFKRACALGEKYGVVICVENMSYDKQALARVERLLEFVKEIDSPYLRVCLDTGHCAAIGGDPAQAVRLLGREYLAVLHVHDNDGTKDQHNEPGKGCIDWEAFTKALLEIGFEGSVSLELSYRSWIAAEDKDAYLSSLARIAGRLANL